MSVNKLAAIGLAFFVLLFAAGNAAADEVDDLFSDSASLDVPEAKTVENPDRELFGAQKFTWSGDFSGTGGAALSWADVPGDIDEPLNPDDSLLLSLKARLWFDARPDDDFRVFGKFTTSYPFANKVDSYGSASAAVEAYASGETAPASTAVSVNNISVFELFADFDWNDRAFFRFGKQNTGWGVSRFYQVADPLSVGVKDPTDPSADLEGPVAFKASVPFGLNSIVFISALKESYLPDDLADASVNDAGFGLKADIYVSVPKNKLVGNGQLSFGAYTQRHLAPKAVLSYSTSVGKFQVFTDQAISRGLDSWRLAGSSTTIAPGVSVRNTEKPKSVFFYSATLGTMYVNNDQHWTLYAEYLFNGAGSVDKDEYADWLARYALETAKTGSLSSTLSASDLAGYLGRHNSGASLSFSEIFGNDDLGLSATWLQNWVDFSGMLRPSFTWSPITRVVIETGANFAWGGDKTEWVIKNYNASSKTPARTSVYIACKISQAKF